MNKIEIDFDNLEWWAQPLLIGLLLYDQDPEKLKRYAELAEKNKLQDLEDKKLLG